MKHKCWTTASLDQLALGHLKIKFNLNKCKLQVILTVWMTNYLCFCKHSVVTLSYEVQPKIPVDWENLAIKIISQLRSTPKIYQHKNFLPELFLTWKFSDLRYVRWVVQILCLKLPIVFLWKFILWMYWSNCGNFSCLCMYWHIQLYFFKSLMAKDK